LSDNLDKSISLRLDDRTLEIYKKMTHLIYLAEISDLEKIIANDLTLLKKKLPLTGDMTVSFKLESLGIEFIDEWNYILPEDMKKNLDEVHDIVNSWWDESFAETDYKNFPLTETAKIDLAYSLLAGLNARTVYGRLFNTYSVGQISGFFMPPKGVVRTGPGIISCSQAILFYMAEQRGIQLNKLSFSL
jgi:hypothetical protein